MGDYVTLLGAEQVQNAARSIQAAAEEMSRAASYSDETARQQRQFMDDWLQRFEQALEKINPSLPTP